MVGFGVLLVVWLVLGVDYRCIDCWLMFMVVCVIVWAGWCGSELVCFDWLFWVGVVLWFGGVVGWWLGLWHAGLL